MDVCLCTTCETGTTGGQKRASEPLEINPKCWAAILGVRKRAWVLSQSSQYSYLLSYLYSSLCDIFK